MNDPQIGQIRQISEKKPHAKLAWDAKNAKKKLYPGLLVAVGKDCL
jgi:hypothetical protein